MEGKGREYKVGGRWVCHRQTCQLHTTTSCTTVQAVNSV